MQDNLVKMISEAFKKSSYYSTVNFDLDRDSFIKQYADLIAKNHPLGFSTKFGGKVAAFIWDENNSITEK